MSLILSSYSLLLILLPQIIYWAYLMSLQLKMLPLCLVIYLVVHFPHFKITRHDYKHVSRFSLCKLRRKDTEWKIMSCHQKLDHDATTLSCNSSAARERYFATLLQCLIILYKCAWPRLAEAEVIRPHEERHRQDLSSGISFKCDVKVLLCITPSWPWWDSMQWQPEKIILFICILLPHQLESKFFFFFH